MDIYKPLVALLAIVNPIGVIPFFIHSTQGFSRVMTRLMGLILAALGVEIMSDGLVKLFPILASAAR